jgi:hypothetical protein
MTSIMKLASSGKENNVQIAVRVRPLSAAEKKRGCRAIVTMDQRKTTVTDPQYFAPDPLTQKSFADKGTDATGFRKKFTYDFCFWSCGEGDKNYAPQQSVFDCIGGGVVENTLKGFNSSVLAYGQTGSGKTFTMMGPEGGVCTDRTQLGLIPRICKQLFTIFSESGENTQVTSHELRASYLEIYDERVRDLVATKPASVQHPDKLVYLRVREHPEKGAYVEGLSNLLVESYSDVDKLLQKGNQARSTAATNMNEYSSRSHAIFELTAEFTMANVLAVRKSRICLVDLAGSERAQSTGCTSTRLKEACAINKSLSTLSEVIKALAKRSKTGDDETFTPYRNSVLTWLLKDSLGGNSKTVMIASISPCDTHYAETLSTLR